MDTEFAIPASLRTKKQFLVHFIH